MRTGREVLQARADTDDDIGFGSQRGFARADAGSGPLAGASVLIWTTTPWTIPANRAISYGPEIAYGLYEVTALEEGLDYEPWAKPGDRFIIADKLAEDVFKAAKISGFTRVDAINPSGLECAHPLAALDSGYGFSVPLLAGDHVTDDAGTGFVHTAPSHGDDDYQLGLKFGLPMAGVMLTVHVALPTHPGAAAAAGILHSDVGWLMLAVMLVMVPTALFLGVLSGMREGSRLDRSLSIIAIATTATPEYVSGVILVAIFAFVFLGERPSLREWAGIALVAAGVLVLAIRR